MPKPPLSRSILSSYLWSVGSLAVSKGLRFAGIVLCIRLVGNYAWGEVASTVAAYSFLTFLVDQGLGSAPLLYRLQDRGADRHLLTEILGYRLTLATLVILAIHGAHAWTGFPGTLAVAYSFVLVPRALSIEWWFHRREYYQVNMFIGALRTLLFFGLVVLCVRKGTSARTVIYVEMIAEAASVALGFGLMGLARAPATGEPSPPVPLRHLLAFSFPILVVGILTNVQASMDLVLMGLFLGKEQVARFDMGMKICLLYFFVGGTIVQIIRPKLTRLQELRDTARIVEILRAVSGVLLLLGAAALLPSLYFPEASVTALYGERRDVIELPAFVFRWASVWVNASFLTILTADTLLALGYRGRYLAGAWICAVANVASNLVLLKGFGAHGAVFAKILSEAAFFAFAYLRLPREVRLGIRGALGLQAVAVALLVAIHLLSARAGSPAAGLSVSLLLFGGLLVSGKVVNRDTFRIFRGN